MIAIHTRYLGPTDTHGARVKGTIYRDGKAAYSATVHYDGSLDAIKNHANAAYRALERMAANWMSHGGHKCDHVVFDCSRCESADNRGYIFLAGNPWEARGLARELIGVIDL